MQVVKINSLWCTSCIIMNNLMNNFEKEYNLNIISYDYDADNNEIQKYNIGKTLPVYILYDKDNNELERIIGEKSKKQIIEILDKYKDM